MKKTAIFCDVCDRDITFDDERYKFKKYENTYANFDDFERNKWTKLDMCKDCFYDFAIFCEERKKRK